MDFIDGILFVEPDFLDLGLPRRSPRANPLAVVKEGLSKLDKPSGQVAEEKLKEIDSLHEPTTRETVLEFCAECWVEWPCATHRAIYGETKDNCVHRNRPGT